VRSGLFFGDDVKAPVNTRSRRCDNRIVSISQAPGPNLLAITPVKLRPGIVNNLGREFGTHQGYLHEFCTAEI